VTRIYFRDAVAAIIVFDVTNRDTLEKTAKWIDDLRAEAPENCILCLTGNKIDLEDKRVVPQEDMIVFAQKHSIDMVFETSAKTNYGMDDMIYEIASEIDLVKDRFTQVGRTTSVSLDPSLAPGRRGSTIKENNRDSKDLTKGDFVEQKGMSKTE
jgi:GTPase SAR1 family protein